MLSTIPEAKPLPHITTRADTASESEAEARSSATLSIKPVASSAPKTLRTFCGEGGRWFVRRSGRVSLLGRVLEGRYLCGLWVPFTA
jgi:hypothetical protein